MVKTYFRNQKHYTQIVSPFDSNINRPISFFLVPGKENETGHFGVKFQVKYGLLYRLNLGRGTLNDG